MKKVAGEDIIDLGWKSEDLGLSEGQGACEASD